MTIKVKSKDVWLIVKRTFWTSDQDNWFDVSEIANTKETAETKKAALESFTKSLAKELAPDIRVNALAPGIILWHDANEIDDEAKVELINKTSLRRIGEPKDISSAAYMLYKSTYITGQIIKVDGGRSI